MRGAVTGSRGPGLGAVRYTGTGPPVPVHRCVHRYHRYRSRYRCRTAGTGSGTGGTGTDRSPPH